MSTDLVGVRVIDIDRAGPRVRLRVFVVYYDTRGGYHEPLPYDISFFARALRNAAEWHGTGGGLADSASQDDWLDEAWVDANAWRFVRRFEELCTRNEPVTDYSAYSDFYYARQGHWADEDKLVQGDYDVWLSDERWLDGLVLGASFGTTAYNTQADTGDLRLAELLPEPQRTRATLELFAPEGSPTGAAPAVSIALSDDQRWLVVGNCDGEVVVVDTARWEVRRRLERLDPSEARALEFEPDAPRLRLHPGRWVELPDGAQPPRAPDAGGPVGPQLRRAGGRGARLRVTREETDDGDTFVFARVADGAELTSANTLDEPVVFAVARDERAFALTLGSELQLWDVDMGRVATRIALPEWPSTLAFAPDGRFLLAGFAAGEAYGFVVYELPAGREVRRVLPRVSGLSNRDGTVRPDTVEFALWTDAWVALVMYQVSPPPMLHTERVRLRVLECGAPPVLPAQPGTAAEPAAPTIDRALVERVARGAARKSPEELARIVAAHARSLAETPPPERERYLNELYPDPLWQVVSVAGLPLAVPRSGRSKGASETPEGDASDAAKRAVLRLSNLEGAALRGASLPMADLTGAYAPGVNLEGADLFGAAMTDAVFAGACFRGADLRAADLSRSDLRGADFTGARLESTDLEGADLCGADFTGARVGGIKLARARVEGVRGFGSDAGRE